MSLNPPTTATDGFCSFDSAKTPRMRKPVCGGVPSSLAINGISRLQRFTRLRHRIHEGVRPDGGAASALESAGGVTRAS
jgi:hypothetical protein